MGLGRGRTGALEHRSAVTAAQRAIGASMNAGCAWTHRGRSKALGSIHGATTAVDNQERASNRASVREGGA